MADASISMLLNRLAPMIEKKVRDEVCLMLNANDEAKKLELKLKKIQEVLMDAEQKALMDRKVKSWLDKLQDISYDIEEVLDQWNVEIQKRRLDELDDAASDSSDSLLQKVSSFLQSLCLCFRENMERRTIAKDIQKLNERLEVIDQENEKEFKFIPTLSRGSQDFKRIITTSFVDVSEVYGRNDDLELLKKILLPESGSVEADDIQIVSLVGMGGMGKTTLAQLIFNDDIVQDHFDVNIWVCVSDPFDQIKIAKAILDAVDVDYPNLSQLETLMRSIKNSIAGKRFLLVLDDVWTEDETMWNPLKIAMKNGAPGSRILVTTRNEKVAKNMGSTQIQLLNPLSDKDCWSVLSQIAFHGRNEGDRYMLKDIGWEIALKCKGMPLAARVLGSVLRSKNSLLEWSSVLKSKLWEMDVVRTDIFPVLAFSYNELHPTVKRCFSYCAIYPKDFLIDVDDLVRTWMAQGFLYSSGSSGDMESKGREYFEDLAVRSFFQDFERGGPGDIRIIRCKMHDLVHDFAQSLTNNECLIAENIEVPIKDVRHLNLLKFEAEITMNIFLHCQIQKLRSFICADNEIPQTLFKHLKRVKLLRLIDCELKDVPTEIGNLIHLRFLDLSHNGVLEKLPKSICDLYNLQTLDLRGCRILCGLPHGIQRLVNLRHLFVAGTLRDEFEFTQGLEKLVDLRSLDYFCCGRGCGNKLGYLKDLNLIGGSLRIQMNDMNDVVDAKNAYLKNKASIEHLTIDCWGTVGEVGERVIDALQPSPNLCGLDFIGSYFPNWITTLINIRKLRIEGGGNDIDVLHSLRNLPFLEDLTLFKLRIEHLRVGFFGLSTAATTTPPSAFHNLSTFRLIGCSLLTHWEDIGEENKNIISVLPRLQHLYIYGCRKLKALPHRLLREAALSLRVLDIINCEYLGVLYDKEGEGRDEISHIPIVKIRG